MHSSSSHKVIDGAKSCLSFMSPWYIGHLKYVELFSAVSGQGPCLFWPGWLAWAAETPREGVSCSEFGCQLVPIFPFFPTFLSSSDFHET